MAQQAQVTSIEAIDTFRARLIAYVNEAGLTLDEVTTDIARTRMWLQDEQRIHWEGTVRRRSREVERLRQEEFSARLSSLRNASGPRKDLRRAEAALADSQAKLEVLKRWHQQFDSRIDPLARDLDRLRNALALDLPKGVSILTRVMDALSAYVEASPPPADGGPGPDDEPAHGDAP
jgi:chromosome segregation ATPase